MKNPKTKNDKSYKCSAIFFDISLNTVYKQNKWRRQHRLLNTQTHTNTRQHHSHCSSKSYDMMCVCVCMKPIDAFRMRHPAYS